MVLKKQKNISSKSKTSLKKEKSSVPKEVIGKRNRQRGQAYERQIVKELRELTGDEELCTSRSESKKLDDMKIDIADPNNILPFYCQIKATQATPQIKKINAEVGKKDKPLIVMWNAQEARDKKQISVGEYCILSKEFFYNLLKKYFEKS